MLELNGRPLLNLILQRIPNPRLRQVFALLCFNPLLLRSHFLHAKFGHGPQVVPPPCLVLHHCVLSVSHVVYDAEAPLCWTQMACLHGAEARLCNGAHGREGKVRRRGEGAVDEALEDRAAGASGWREVDVDVSDKGGCCVCNEDERDEAAESNWWKVSCFSDALRLAR